MEIEQNQRNLRLVIRIGKHSLSFASIAPALSSAPVTFQPYVVKSGMSMAANLREAFKGADLRSQDICKVQVLMDVPVLMVPVEQFQEPDIVELYRYAFPGHDQDAVLYNVLPDLNAVTVFAMNKDLKLVVDDNFSDAKFIVAMSPVWRHLYQRSFTGARNKLYGYFRERRLDVFSFQQNRFKFCNSYEVDAASNALYFLLAVWKVLGMDATHDELHLAGEFSESEQLLSDAQQFLKRVFFIHPSGEFNRAPITQIPHIPYDLVTLYIKGR